MFSRSIAKLMALIIKTTIQKSYLLVLPVKSNALVKKLAHALIALRNEFVSMLVIDSTAEMAWNFLTYS